MPRKRDTDRSAQDGTTVRISGPAAKVMDGLITAIQDQSGEKMSPGDVVFAGLKMLAKEISPGLLAIQSGADILAAAVQKAPLIPDQPGGAPRTGGSGPASAGR